MRPVRGKLILLLLAAVLLVAAVLGISILFPPAPSAADPAPVSPAAPPPAQAGDLVLSSVPIRVLASDTRQPIVGARVKIGDRETFTDPAGQFDLGLVAPGTSLRVVADGFVSHEWSLGAAFADVVTLDPVLTAIVVLDGGTARPVMGATVAGGSQRATTGADGRTQLRALPPNARIQVSAVGYVSFEMPYASGPQLTVRLQPVATPAPSLAPSAGPAQSAGPATAAPTRTITPTLTAQSAGPAPSSAPSAGPAQSGGPAPAPLALQMNLQTRSGTLRDAANGRPVAGASLWLDQVLTQTDASGGFQFTAAASNAASILTVKISGYRLSRIPLSPDAPLQMTLQPFQVRGIHIYYAMPRDRVLALLDRLQATEVNALVIDVKSDRGEIVWPSQVPLAKAVGAYYARGIELNELIQQCRARNLYCIARTVVMKDDKVAYARPDLALHTPDGRVYADNTAAWLNPAKREVHDYAVALARELVGIGFDEVQVDYIRYPGRFGAVEVGTPDSRVAMINQLMAAHQAAFRTLPAFLSADVFGLTTFTDDENNIGQRLREISRHVDYISPMVYPDTYNAGMLGALGVPNCAVPRACPYQTVFQNVKHAQTRANSLLRIWIQAYGWTTGEYMQEKRAAEEAASYGWIFWNNEGLYDTALFRKK